MLSWIELRGTRQSIKKQQKKVGINTHKYRHIYNFAMCTCIHFMLSEPFEMTQFRMKNNLKTGISEDWKVLKSDFNSFIKRKVREGFGESRERLSVSVLNPKCRCDGDAAKRASAVV